MTSTKKDFLLITIIGLLVGLLVQPVLTNIPSLSLKFASSFGLLRLAAFFVFLLGAPIALWIFQKFIQPLYQFAKFAAVGVLNTFIDLGIVNLEIWMSGIDKGVWFSLFKAISFLLATTNSYAWNRTWTFNASGKASGREATEFYVVAAVGFLLNVGIASLVVNYIGHPGISDKLWAIVGSFTATVCTFLWNFFGYKLVVFKPKAPAPVVA